MIELNRVTTPVKIKDSKKTMEVVSSDKDKRSFLEILKNEGRTTFENTNNSSQRARKNIQPEDMKFLHNMRNHSADDNKIKIYEKIEGKEQAGNEEKVESKEQVDSEDAVDNTQEQNSMIYELIKDLFYLLQQQDAIEENYPEVLQEDLTILDLTEKSGELLKVLETIEDSNGSNKEILSKIEEIKEEIGNISNPQEFLKPKVGDSVELREVQREDIYIAENKSIIKDSELLNTKEASKQQKDFIEEEESISAPKLQESIDTQQHLEVLGLEKELQTKFSQTPYETVAVEELSSNVFLEEISYKVLASFKNGKNQINLQLLPENLGKITIDLSSNNQEIKAKVYVESLQVKEVIESSLNDFKESLKEKGINVLSIEVTVGQQHDHSQQSKNLPQQRMRFRRSPSVNLDGIAGSQELDAIRNINPYIVTTDFDKFG